MKEPKTLYTTFDTYTDTDFDPECYKKRNRTYGMNRNTEPSEYRPSNRITDRGEDAELVLGGPSKEETEGEIGQIDRTNRTYRTYGTNRNTEPTVPTE